MACWWIWAIRFSDALLPLALFFWESRIQNRLRSLCQCLIFLRGFHRLGVQKWGCTGASHAHNCACFSPAGCWDLIATVHIHDVEYT
jgi:hypothetical protein